MGSATLYSPSGRLTCEKLGLAHEVDFVDWRFLLEHDRCTAQCSDVDFGHDHSLLSFFRALAEKYRHDRMTLEWKGMEHAVKLTAELPGAMEHFPLRICLAGPFAGAEHEWSVRATMRIEPAALERFALELRAAANQ